MALVLIVTVVTFSPAVPGTGLRAVATDAADTAAAKLSGPSTTLAGVASEITRQFATQSDGITVLDTQGHALSQSSSTPQLTPAVSPAALRASLAGSDVRLTAWEGGHQTASTLLPVRSKGRPAGVIVATGSVAWSSGIGTARTVVILICAALLAALGLIAGRSLRQPSSPGAVKVRPDAPSARTSRRLPSENVEESTAGDVRLIKRLLELEEIAPSGVFLERIQATLAEAGVLTVDPHGKPFDPKSHRAAERVSTSDASLHNTVAETIKPGYSLGGRVLRQAEVAVYRKPNG